MSDTVIQVEKLSKLYRLGEVGTGSLAHDVNRWWHRFRGKEDPYTKVGQVNDRTKKAESHWVWALQDINFEVKQGEVLGIIGRNGAGKSTLLKILSRVTAPTTGAVRVKGRIASLLEVGTGFHPELTGRQNIFLNGAIMGMTQAEIRSKLDQIVDFSGCEAYLDTPVKRYSSGMQVRLAFAVAAHLEPEILIVDEVLAVGDAEFQRKCIGKMGEVAKEGRTVLFVSHNLASMQQLCGSGVLLGTGTVLHKGDINSAVSAYAGLEAPVDFREFPVSPTKPSIRTVRAVRPNRDDDDLIIEIQFESPYPLRNPIPGIVLSSELGIPLFGTNARFDLPLTTANTILCGTGIVHLKNISLHGGRYRISAWLGDWENDYDEKIDAITIDLNSESRSSLLPQARHIGHFKVNAEWRIHDSST